MMLVTTAEKRVMVFSNPLDVCMFYEESRAEVKTFAAGCI
jgi:hypothetical protein